MAAFAGRRLVALLILTCLVPALDGAEKPLPPTIRFNRDIRPILSDNCYKCHGPDHNKRKAKLRLDTREGLTPGTGEDALLVAGQPERSELYQRLTTTDLDDRMPAVQSGKTLTDHQIALIRKWIEQGARWEGHWAYTPPVRPAQPQVQDGDWPINPIDRFVLARLEMEGLRPSPEADARTLVRRLSFDLTGLPPTRADLNEFRATDASQAVEQLVESKLASPHFGERMALYWLDLVRYADTDGYHGDNYRSVYPYRDYVIHAFNDNMPFDRFTREQLAGDLLPEATTEQLIASTYNRLGRTTEEGGAQAKEYLVKYATDRVRTASSVWLGATMGCAQCHDHKFDPFTQKDFYQFAAFFADVKEKGVGKPEPVLVPSAEQKAELRRMDQAIEKLKRTLATPTDALRVAQAQWEQKTLAAIKEQHSIWTVVQPAGVQSKNGATLTIQPDQSVLASGKNPDTDVYTVTLPANQKRVTAIRLEALTHPSLVKKSLSRANGNFVLTEVEVAVQRQPDAEAQPVKLASALADFSQKDYPVAKAIDGKPDTGWAVDGHNRAADHQAAFVFAEPIAGGPGVTLTVRLKQQSGFKQHQIGRFRLALTAREKPTLEKYGLPEDIFAALQERPAQRTAEQSAALANYYRGITPLLDPARKQLKHAKKQREDFEKNLPRTLATQHVKPRVMRVLARGNWQDDSGPVVTPAVPDFLALKQITDRRATRLDLADWIMDARNPLTARVFVNRLWMLFFGTGLSRVLDDLGSQGEYPTHPDLLDWLAVEFRESGWDVKHLVRLLVTSRTYRQASVPNARLREKDPLNRLLARQSRFRLDAEVIRDNALAISGLLVDRIGGPSVKPYQPAGYWAQLNFPKRKWKADQGEALYRRGLYTFWCRTFLHPSLMAFDAPSREECTALRVRSNTPGQALVLLNDPIFVEAARVFGEHILQQEGGVGVRLDWAFERALQRAPRPAERALLQTFFDHEHRRFQADPEAARQFVRTGQWPVPEDADPVDLASWASVARVVLNLHETIERF